MSIRLGALEDALLDGGTSPELAAKAAEELANYDRDIAGIKADLTGVRADLTILKWSNVTILGLVLTVALKLFVH